MLEYTSSKKLFIIYYANTVFICICILSVVRHSLYPVFGSNAVNITGQFSSFSYRNDCIHNTMSRQQNFEIN